MYKYGFDCKDNELEEKLEEEADALNSELRSFFDCDDLFNVVKIEVSFGIHDNNQRIDAIVRYITRNGLRWKYWHSEEHDGTYHRAVCLDNEDYTFDWWS